MKGRESHRIDSTLMCTEKCTLLSIKHRIDKNQKDCNLMSKQARSKYSYCFALCGGCRLKKSRDRIINDLSTNHKWDFSINCSKKMNKEVDVKEHSISNNNREESSRLLKYKSDDYELVFRIFIVSFLAIVIWTIYHSDFWYNYTYYSPVNLNRTDPNRFN